MINEYSKSAQKKYKSTQDLRVKVIRQELCKKCKFYYMNRWYMHNSASVLENETLNSSEILRFKLITSSSPDDQSLL